jgi:hypothetical protein
MKKSAGKNVKRLPSCAGGLIPNTGFDKTQGNENNAVEAKQIFEFTATGLKT